MKKGIMIIMLFLLCGCASSNEMNISSYHENVTYNGVHNAMQSIPMIETENGVYAYPSAEGRKETYYFPLQIKGDKVYSLVNNKYSTCSYESVDSCSSFMESYNVNMTYYKGKLYFYEKRIEVEKRLNYLMDIDIKEGNIDLSHRNKTYTIASFGEPVFYEMTYTYPNIQFHKNKVYACYNNELYIGNINSIKLNKLDVYKQKNVMKVFLDEEHMYLYVKEYAIDEVVYKNVLLLCDLNGKIIEVVLLNKNILFADNSNVFYKDVKEEIGISLYNQKTKESTFVASGNYQQILKKNNTYLMDTMGNRLDVNHITIIDEKGNIVADKTYNGIRHISALYTNDKYYVYSREDDWFGYYDITEKGISDFKLCSNVENGKESE